MTKYSANLDLHETVGSGETINLGAKNTARLAPVVLATMEDIQSGTILIKSDVRLPNSVLFESKQYGYWRVLTGVDGFAVERRLSTAGWHFFFVVPEIKAAAVSSTRQGALKKALRKVTGATEGGSLNALEIVKIRVRHFLWFYYVMVTAHTRHVKASPFLRDLDPYHTSRQVWDFKQVLRRRAEIAQTAKGV